MFIALPLQLLVSVLAVISGVMQIFALERRQKKGTDHVYNELGTRKDNDYIIWGKIHVVVELLESLTTHATTF